MEIHVCNFRDDTTPVVPKTELETVMQKLECSFTNLDICTNRNTLVVLMKNALF